MGGERQGNRVRPELGVGGWDQTRGAGVQGWTLGLVPNAPPSGGQGSGPSHEAVEARVGGVSLTLGLCPHPTPQKTMERTGQRYWPCPTCGKAPQSCRQQRQSRQRGGGASSAGPGLHPPQTAKTGRGAGSVPLPMPPGPAVGSNGADRGQGQQMGGEHQPSPSPEAAWGGRGPAPKVGGSGAGHRPLSPATPSLSFFTGNWLLILEHSKHIYGFFFLNAML